jgi:hypothetical protein
VTESQFDQVLNIELDLYNDRGMQISIFVRYAGMIGTIRPTHYHELFDEYTNLTLQNVYILYIALN